MDKPTVFDQEYEKEKEALKPLMDEVRQFANKILELRELNSGNKNDEVYTLQHSILEKINEKAVEITKHFSKGEYLDGYGDCFTL